MEWQILVPLLIVVPLILFPAVFIWYLNIGGLYAAIKERKTLKAFAPVARAMRIGLAVIVPIGIYAFLIWFFYGNFGWQVALAVALAFPIVLLVPALIWASVISGLYEVVRETLRRRVTASRRRRIARLAEERAAIR